MRELLDDLDRWRVAGTRVALARVVDVEGSGPRGPGAAMAVSENGEVVGSVSGGCVEGAVVTESLAVGLTCGGTIRLYVEEYDW
ncbi:MAG: XdhC family protein [Ilumatobacter sp.]